MIDDQTRGDAPEAKKTSDSPTDLSGIHTVALAISLRDVAHRLSSVEDKLDKERASGSRRGTFFIEFCKVVFGGWPVLGLLFLLLFYSPLRDALNAIPEKVRTAAEIGALGVSLKSTVQVEAAKLGAGNLSETIPRLSGAAIELLLRAPRNSESLVTATYDVYEGDSKRGSETVEFPSSSEIEAISELQVQGLIELESDQKKITGADARRIIDNFLKTHPGRELRSYRYARMVWEPTKRRGPNEYPPQLMLQLSELGKKAVEVILRAVSTELAPQPSPKRNP